MMSANPNQRGFSLIELAIAIAIMAFLATISVPFLVEGINERRAGVTIQETQTILDAARVYRQQTGSWPGAPACSTALTVLKSGATPLLAGVGTNNKYNSAYTTSCNANTFSVDQNIIADWDGVVANGLPATQIVNASTNQIRSTIGAPGSEAALNDKLSRVAGTNIELNRMRTNLLLGNNDISEVGDISTVNLAASGNVTTTTLSVNGRASFFEYLAINAASSEGAACAGGGLYSRTATGQPLSCIGNKWVKTVTWNNAAVGSGQACDTYARGSLAFDATGKLFVCK